MYRIFIPTESVTIAHIVRPLQIAKELRAHGLEVIFGASPRYSSLLKEEGFPVLDLFSAEPEILLDAVRRCDFSRQKTFLDAYLKADIDAVHEIGGADLILSDFRFMAKYAARKLGIPHAAVTNGFFSPYYGIAPELPKALLPLAPEWLRSNRLLRGAVKAVVPRYHAGPYREICKKNGIPFEDIKSGFDFSVSDTLTLICDMPEFTPQRGMPKHYHFTGPILWEPSQGYSEVPEETKSKEGKLIYVSLGTSGQVSGFQSLIKAFARLPYKVLISTGGAPLPDLPANVTALPFVKPAGILKEASLMVCHGGNGSIYQALNASVPVLCITSFYDQEWNGQRVRELGLGQSVFHKDVTEASMMKLLPSLIGNDICKRRVQEFQVRMANHNGARTAAEKIISFLASRRIGRTSYAPLPSRY